MAKVPQFRIEYMATDSLIPYARNAKIHTDEQVRQIADSMEAFGFNDPVGVWTRKDGRVEIVEGHGRVMAAKLLGIEKVPVIRLDHMTDDERRAYVHVHNQTTLSSGFDMEALKLDLKGIELDMSPWFDGQDMSGAVPSDLEDPEVPETVVCRAKRGDVWQLGEHRVMCGDSSDAGDMAILVAGGVAPMMVFTDPPYGVAIGSKNKAINEAAPWPGGRIQTDIIGDTLSTDELYALLVRCFSNLKAACDPDCTYYVSSPQGGEIGLMMMMMMMRDAGLPVRHNLIWAKNNATFSMGRLDYDYKHEPIFYTWGKRHRFYGKNETTLLEFDKPMASKLHPTMKPVALVAHLMENSSLEGDCVMDIFGGSGTTLIAAEQLGRTCYMMEVDPHYVDVIIARWEELTGRTAVLAEEHPQA